MIYQIIELIGDVDTNFAVSRCVPGVVHIELNSYTNLKCFYQFLFICNSKFDQHHAPKRRFIYSMAERNSINYAYLSILYFSKSIHLCTMVSYSIFYIKALNLCQVKHFIFIYNLNIIYANINVYEF